MTEQQLDRDGLEVDSTHERLVFDSIAALVLLFTALIGAYLPRYLSRNGALQAGSASSLAFHLGNMLSGGVMLSAGFCHLLADALRQLAFIGRFPIATFLAAVGYLITLLADQIVTAITAEPDSHDISHSRDHKYVRLDAQQDHLGAAETIEMVEHPGSAAAAPAAAGGTSSRKGCCDSGLALLSLGVDDRQQPQHWQQQQQQPALPHCRPRVAVATTVLGAHELSHAHADDLATCIFASSSPRAITAGSTHPRASAAAAVAMANGHHHCHAASCLTPPADSPDQDSDQPGRSGIRAAEHPDQAMAEVTPAGAADAAVCHACGDVGCATQQHKQQQQQQQWQRPWGQQQVGCCTPKLGCLQAVDQVASPHYQQQQQQVNGGSQYHSSQQQQPWEGIEGGDWAAGAYLEAGLGNSSNVQLARSQSGVGPSCSCCCHRHGAAASRPEGMTEARSVARAVEHLELDMAGRAGAAPAGAGASGHNHAHFQVFLSHRPLTFYTTLLLACALCIHSILEGIALGAQESMEATRDIMLAIAAHKGLAAYALGASIVESNASTCKFWSVVTMFAFATPVGIAIGFATSTVGHGSASAAMSALASGTFLYVALNEVIPKELEHPDGHRLIKVAALLIGFGLMSLLAVWA